MPIWIRRAVYLFFILVFIVIAPLLILYTQGYRYNFKKQRLDATGTLVVSTIPRGATITLNGQTLKSITPETLQAIIPAKYNIRLSKTGYKSWEKRLTLQAGAAVFVSNIRLWKDTMPANISSAIYQLFAPSPTGREFILTAWNGNREQFFLFDELSGTAPVLLTERPIQKPTKNLLWSPQGERILVVSPAGISILKPNETPKLQTLADFIPDTINRFRWDSDNPDVLYGADQKTVYRFDLFRKTAAPLIASTSPPATQELLTDFWLQEETLYELTKNEATASSLLTIPLRTKTAPRRFTLPTNKSYERLDANNDLLILRDAERTMSVWRLTNESFLPVLTVPDVSRATISAATNDLLYSTSFEIWTYNPKTNARNLLTRIAAPVEEALWYPDSSHVLFAAGRTLSLIERDERDTRNQWPLFSFNNLTGYAFSPDGNALYFAGTIANSSGLWKLDL